MDVGKTGRRSWRERRLIHVQLSQSEEPVVAIYPATIDILERVGFFGLLEDLVGLSVDYYESMVLDGGNLQRFAAALPELVVSSGLGASSEDEYALMILSDLRDMVARGVQCGESLIFSFGILAH